MLAALNFESVTVANDNAYGERLVNPRVPPVAGWVEALEARVDAWLLRRAASPRAVDGADVDAKIEHAIRGACVRAALLGAAAGALSTAAAIVAVETGGVGLVVAAPVVAAVAVADVIARGAVHVGLAATMASIMGEEHDPESAWGRATLRELVGAEALEAAQKGAVGRDARVAGGRQFARAAAVAARHHGGEAARSTVPVLGIFMASIDAWRSTRRAGLAMARRLRREG